MFRFEHPEYFYGFLLVPVFIFIFIKIRQDSAKKMQLFAENHLWQSIAGDYAPFKHSLKFYMWLTALLFLLIAAANPQWGTKRERVTRKSTDVFIAIDVSQSMMAQDVLPSRLERAKQVAIRLLEGLKTNRIGTIVFAGGAYLQMPLTTDYATASIFLRSASTDMVSEQGTSLAQAIALADTSFQDNNLQNKTLLILTDGEDHDESAENAAQKAARNGVTTHLIGLGTTEGAPIPTLLEDGSGGYKKDENGDIILSKINPEMMQKVAEAGNGQYYFLNDTEQIIANIKKSIDKMSKQETETRLFSSYESYYQYPLFLAFIVLLWEGLISYRKTKLMSEINWFGTAKKS